MNRVFVKRLFDLMISISVLILTFPLLCLITVLVRISLGSPVFFRQTRSGYKGYPFLILKYRTMTDKRDGTGVLLPDIERITPLGRFLRATSLDELPELFNVLKGDMSLVGPRPLLARYLGFYSPEQKRRLDVVPGITGWAQINGRNALSWEDKFALDIWYIDHWSIWLDMKILFLTIWRILAREGITQPGQATAEEFRGNSVT